MLGQVGDQDRVLDRPDTVGDPIGAERPNRQLMRAGVPVTINSDDPPMFKTRLTDEYLKIAESCRFRAR